MVNLIIFCSSFMNGFNMLSYLVKGLAARDYLPTHMYLRWVRWPGLSTVFMMSQARSQNFALGSSDFEGAKGHTYFCFLFNYSTILKKKKKKVTALFYYYYYYYYYYYNLASINNIIWIVHRFLLPLVRSTLFIYLFICL